ncbi:hypothetical protein [Aeromicrobium sp. Sec7.5]|uniref:hypothetical protein n=1 Tax=Aeromicrobium sp. Sec7.5 TaxID=3121276 RepID=UPI002FE4DA95
MTAQGQGHASSDDRIRHLDFIQLTITRMAANSFLLKGWAVTLVAALFALAASDSEQRYVFIAYMPIVVFWSLDAFYLSQERKYRGLYDEVRQLPADQIDFNLSTAHITVGNTGWIETVMSRTQIGFYASLLAATALVTISINR